MFFKTRETRHTEKDTKTLQNDDDGQHHHLSDGKLLLSTCTEKILSS